MEKYQNKYRIKTNRLQNWDYGWNGAYFVTICTKNREHYFGNIYDDKIKFTNIGKLAEKYWSEIPKHFPFVKSDVFVVMPNHIHEIIIDKIDDKYNGRRNVETPKLGVSTEDVKTKSIIGRKNPKWKPNILGTIINQYKRICTINARKINPDFAWQPRFYDHIIRNEESFNNISKYIINNPQNWNNDELYNQMNNKTNTQNP